MNKYCYLSGRVNMKVRYLEALSNYLACLIPLRKGLVVPERVHCILQAIEKTIQNLIGSGMDPKTQNNPYYGFIYTSFQERATKVSPGKFCAQSGLHRGWLLSRHPGVDTNDA